MLSKSAACVDQLLQLITCVACPATTTITMLRPIARSSLQASRQVPWRGLATEAGQTVSPSAHPPAPELEELVPDDEYIPPPQTLTVEDAKKLNKAPKNYLWARTLDYITSPADALAIIDALEHRYGRIREFRFLRVRSFLNSVQGAFLTMGLGL
jgi:hypothetical protein